MLDSFPAFGLYDYPTTETNKLNKLPTKTEPNTHAHDDYWLVIMHKHNNHVQSNEK